MDVLFTLEKILKHPIPRTITIIIELARLNAMPHPMNIERNSVRHTMGEIVVNGMWETAAMKGIVFTIITASGTGMDGMVKNAKTKSWRSSDAHAPWLEKYWPCD